MLTTVIGGLAATLTSLSYIPQIWKAWKTQETADISYGMLAVLGSGLALWVAYGFSKGDWVIIISNIVAITLIGVLATIKARAKG
jgi:MtN3 and saliva related transmembrane protein